MQANNTTDTNTQQPVAAKFTNGWLAGLDGRLGLAKELRQRFAALTDDLGGSVSLSYAQVSLCERALWLEYWLAQQERDLAAGGEFDVNRWIQATNSLQGIFAKLGLERRAKNVQSLDEWVAARGGQR